MCAERQLAGHPNIVQMLGFCDETIVTEYFGNFHDIVFREGRELPIVEVVSMALDAARGMQVRLPSHFQAASIQIFGERYSSTCRNINHKADP